MSKCTVEVRWVGDPLSEVQAIAALGYPSMMEVRDGLYERWMRVPASKQASVLEAIVAAGGRVL